MFAFGNKCLSALSSWKKSISVSKFHFRQIHCFLFQVFMIFNVFFMFFMRFAAFCCFGSFFCVFTVFH